MVLSRRLLDKRIGLEALMLGPSGGAFSFSQKYLT
jgi:hypothetical protein